MRSTAGVRLARRLAGGAIGALIAGLAATSALAQSVAAHPVPATKPVTKTERPAVAARPRLIVLTDIGADPDDEMSVVRLLLYSTDYDIEAMIANTSVWQRTRVQPQLIAERVRAYGQVLPNLRRHASGWPDAEALLTRVGAGVPEYGMAGVGEGKDSDGSRRIIAAVDRDDPRPVWVALWGGANSLAQALWRVRHDRSPAEVGRFVAKLRVYSISDQDDSNAWIRATFPQLWWVGSIHAFSSYENAAWLGIHLPAPTAASDMTTDAWLDAHIRKGPLGALYPHIAFGMEGDTPSFLNLIANGLSQPDHPDWGGWGGRYGKVAEAYGLWADVVDKVTGADGKLVMSNQATIWRWRAAYQNDFAARIQWSITPDARGANHNPHLVLNGLGGTAPLQISACPGDTIRLSASGSSDPDRNALTYRWWQYADVDGGFMPDKAQIATPDADQTAVTIPAARPPGSGEGPYRRFHVILEVTDNGAPPLTSYRRAVISVPAEPAGCPSRAERAG